MLYLRAFLLSDQKAHTFFPSQQKCSALKKIRLGLHPALTFPVLYTPEKLSHKLRVYMPVIFTDHFKDLNYISVHFCAIYSV